MSARRGERCLVRPAGPGWAHQYRDGITVHPRLGGPSARLQDAAARDMFLHDYEPRPGDVVFDVGAGVGGEVRLMSRLVGPTGQVVSVEAHPRTFGFLRRTIDLNGLTNVTALPVALAGRSGPVHLADDEINHFANGLMPSGGIVVPGQTLPELMALTGVDRIDLLTMNIEGAELEALRAAGDHLDRVCHIAVSCHDFIAAGGPEDPRRTYAPVRELLRRAGFLIRTREFDPRPWARWYLYARR